MEENIMFDMATLENGDTLKTEDLAYNKNKREQVENPHTVKGFFESGKYTYVVLRAPNSDSYIGEPLRYIEKYKENDEKPSTIKVEHEGKEITINIKDVE